METCRYLRMQKVRASKLTANFQADWIAQLRSRLINQGWSAVEVASLDDRDVPVRYFEALRRRIAAVPRALEIADDFSCPPEHQAGWKALQEEVRRGDDLNRRLSKRHASLVNPDGLLAEWGVHHFHLGVVPDLNDPAYIERTGPLLYAMVRDRTFFAINVYTHQSFEDIGILESIHRNWPETIRQYRARGVTGGVWSKEEKRALRSNNGNVCIATADGTVYMPISGGVMASGVNAEALRCADYWQIRIQQIQADFERRIDEVLPALRQRGFSAEDEIEAVLKLSDTGMGGMGVFFPKYGVLATLTLVEGGKSSCA